MEGVLTNPLNFNLNCNFIVWDSLNANNIAHLPLNYEYIIYNQQNKLICKDVTQTTRTKNFISYPGERLKMIFKVIDNIGNTSPQITLYF